MAQYEIIIRNETDQSSSPMANQESNNTSDNDKGKDKKAKKVITGALIYRTGKAIIQSEMAQAVSTIELRTGNSEMQRRYQYGYQIASSVFDVAESIAIGAATGGLAGAAIGTAIGLGMKILNISHKAQIFNLNRELESETLRRNNLRAGIYGSRRDLQ
nr:MAG TPA: hypothetical protein [Bacteriophage sp.]